ncbi:MAG: methyltransferase domain-containing protein [Nocardioides sp.]
MRVGDVQATLRRRSFDVVHAHQVLHHVADPVQSLREMARVATPGGLVAVRGDRLRRLRLASRVRGDHSLAGPLPGAGPGQRR